MRPLREFDYYSDLCQDSDKENISMSKKISSTKSIKNESLPLLTTKISVITKKDGFYNLKIIKQCRMDEFLRDYLFSKSTLIRYK